MVGRQVIPQEDSAKVGVGHHVVAVGVLEAHDGGVLYVGANVVDEVTEDNRCCPAGLDSAHPPARILYAAHHMGGEAGISWLDGHERGDLQSMLVVFLRLYSKGFERPPPCPIALLERQSKLVHINEELSWDILDSNWWTTIPK